MNTLTVVTHDGTKSVFVNAEWRIDTNNNLHVKLPGGTRYVYMAGRFDRLEVLPTEASDA
jgi:hypothetical protein